MSRFEISLPWEDSTTQQSTDGTLDSDGDDNQPHGCLQQPMSLGSPQTFFVPMHYEANYRYPLIVWLHSNGYNENQINHVMPHVSSRNYVATGVRGTRAADSIGHRFDWHDSPAAIDSAHEKIMCAIDEAADRYSIHRERVVIAGYRDGGTMAMRIAMREPKAFAAVASFGGSVPAGSAVMANLSTLRKREIPMLWQVAEESPAYDTGKLKSDITSAMMMKAKVEIRQYKNDDEMNTVALADFNQWVMSRIVAGEPMNSREWGSSPVCFSSN